MRKPRTSVKIKPSSSRTTRGVFIFVRYNELMAIPEAKWAVYYGTIRLDTGEEETFTAQEVAELYGIEDEEYLSVPLTGPLPFAPGKSELEYYHLKPRPDGRYPDAKTLYNTETPNESYLDEDFDARRGGKWQVRPRFDDPDNEY